jgi:hypothetical protein
MLLSLSCYNLACHYFLHLWSTLGTHTCHISCIFLLCSAIQKMKSSLMKTYSRRAGPPVICLWRRACFSLFEPLGLVISFIIRLDIINTSYTIYFTICHFMCEI